MREGKKNDACIVITGDTGSGKSETAKFLEQSILVGLLLRHCFFSLIIHHFHLKFHPSHAHLFAEPRLNVKKVSNLHVLFQSARQLLEAFGNANSVANKNSSRFCMTSELFMDSAQRIIGGRVNVHFPLMNRLMESNPSMGLSM